MGMMESQRKKDQERTEGVKDPLSAVLDLDLSRLLSFLDLSFFDFPSSELDELLRDLLFLDFLSSSLLEESEEESFFEPFSFREALEVLPDLARLLFLAEFL